MKRLLSSVFVIIGVMIGFFITSLPSEACDERGWNLILVNEDYCVPSDYSVDLMKLENGKDVDKKIYPYLIDMFDDMQSEGIYAFVSSGYRTADYQQYLFDERIRKYKNEGYNGFEAFVKAREWVALPNHSEHHLGIAVDINADSQSTSDEVYDWLDKNAYKYGFIKRYPEDKTTITKINYEPWHYRYVGKEHAKYIYENNLCLEEYLQILN